MSKKIEPILTNDKNDPRLKAYSDSLMLHNNFSKDYRHNTPTNRNKQDIKQWRDAFKDELNLYNKDIKPVRYVGISSNQPNGWTGAYYKKPTQPIVYQKPVQSVVQPTVQAIQQAPVVKENWMAIPNTIMYNINGKEMFSTSDKVKDIFKSDIDKMTTAGASQEAIDTILKQKYKIKERGTTYIPDDATQKALVDKVNGNPPLLIKRKQGGTINYDISNILKQFIK